MNKNLFYFLFFLILLFVYFRSNNKENFKEASSDTTIKNVNYDKLRDEVIFTLKIMDELFEKNKIWYIAAYGTLLGAVRHWDIIPWDDDGDVIVNRKDVSKILALKNEFKKHNIEMVEEWKLIKLYPNNLKYPFIDIFIHDDLDGKNIRCKRPFDKECKVPPKSKKFNWWWKWIEYPSEWISERKRLKFGHIKIWGPIKAIKLLKFWYGDDVLTTCMSASYDHVTGKYVKPKKIICKDLPKLQL